MNNKQLTKRVELLIKFCDTLIKNLKEEDNQPLKPLKCELQKIQKEIKELKD